MRARVSLVWARPHGGRTECDTEWAGRGYYVAHTGAHNGAHNGAHTGAAVLALIVLCWTG